MDLPGVRAGHFPQDADGGYCGFNPADGAEAIERLEALRSQGAQYLLVPASALWWLDHYAEFREHLQRTCSEVHRDDCCVIVSLDKRSSVRSVD